MMVGYKDEQCLYQDVCDLFNNICQEINIIVQVIVLELVKIKKTEQAKGSITSERPKLKTKEHLLNETDK